MTDKPGRPVKLTSKAKEIMIKKLAKEINDKVEFRRLMTPKDIKDIPNYVTHYDKQ